MKGFVFNPIASLWLAVVGFIFISWLIYSQELSDKKDQCPAKCREKLMAGGPVVSCGEVANGRQGFLEDEWKSMRRQRAALRKQATELQLRRNTLRVELQHVEEDLDQHMSLQTGEKRWKKINDNIQILPMKIRALLLPQPYQDWEKELTKEVDSMTRSLRHELLAATRCSEQVWTAAVQAKKELERIQANIHLHWQVLADLKTQ